MKSIKEIYKIGNGPSSSHTIGPKRAAEYVLDKYKDATLIEAILYGSLSLTGKGHLTDYIILDETTSEIDIETERKILNNIKTEYNKTIIFISHRDSNKDLFNKRVQLKGGNL